MNFAKLNAKKSRKPKRKLWKLGSSIRNRQKRKTLEHQSLKT